MCCFNRREYTKRCIETLLQSFKEYGKCKNLIYVCDDGSTDGTKEMLQKEYPQVRLIDSPGNLYWCKSMYRAMKEAVRERFDYYLMVNDDVEFVHNAVEIMMKSYQMARTECGIVGSTKAKEDKVCTYGGRDTGMKLISPNGKLQECVWAEWNCFLIGHKVVEKVGIIDGKYQHAYGDYDYSYRMRKVQLPLYVAIEYVGICEQNSLDGTFRDDSIDKKKRLKLLLSPKGIPFYSFLRYNCKTKGIIAGLRDTVYGYASYVYYIIMKKEF